MADSEESLRKEAEYSAWKMPKVLERPQVLNNRKKAPRTWSQATRPPLGGGVGAGWSALGFSSGTSASMPESWAVLKRM